MILAASMPDWEILLSNDSTTSTGRLCKGHYIAFILISATYALNYAIRYHDDIDCLLSEESDTASKFSRRHKRSITSLTFLSPSPATQHDGLPSQKASHTPQLPVNTVIIWMHSSGMHHLPSSSFSASYWIHHHHHWHSPHVITTYLLSDWLRGVSCMVAFHHHHSALTACHATKMPLFLLKLFCSPTLPPLHAPRHSPAPPVITMFSPKAAHKFHLITTPRFTASIDCHFTNKPPHPCAPRYYLPTPLCPPPPPPAFAAHWTKLPAPHIFQHMPSQSLVGLRLYWFSRDIYTKLVAFTY